MGTTSYTASAVRFGVALSRLARSGGAGTVLRAGDRGVGL